MQFLFLKIFLSWERKCFILFYNKEISLYFSLTVGTVFLGMNIFCRHFLFLYAHKVDLRWKANCFPIFLFFKESGISSWNAHIHVHTNTFACQRRSIKNANNYPDQSILINYRRARTSFSFTSHMKRSSTLKIKWQIWIKRKLVKKNKYIEQI